jgi:hypothetical protein
MPIDGAIAVLEGLAGTRFEARLVERFLEIVRSDAGGKS